MRLCKVLLPSGETHSAVLTNDDRVRILPASAGGNRLTIAELLHHENPRAVITELAGLQQETLALTGVKLLAPVDGQEIWAAGVTYKRSEEARKRESVGAAQFYDKVYTASRPELFFKAPAYRASPPGGPVHIRRDSKWSVPEPELALVISPALQLVGFTIGNDLSARVIAGENPL
jgi:2-dehydro-3-deoxy-D-arabinonate dehydratase